MRDFQHLPCSAVADLDAIRPSRNESRTFAYRTIFCALVRYRRERPRYSQQHHCRFARNLDDGNPGGNHLHGDRDVSGYRNFGGAEMGRNARNFWD